ncbi:MAG: protein kinase [Kofleriaceae bacterium]
MTTPTREEIELYVMGAFDGDPAALEAAIAADPAIAADVAGEARFELLLRDAAAAAAFCPACDDLVRETRCDRCGAALCPGGYTVERVLVSNAHGRMYVARDVDGKQVALKELAFVQSPAVTVIAAFEREAKFLRALEHPAIPRFVASFEEGSGVHARYYLAQELVTGVALDARLEDHWFKETEILDIARQVLTVLVYLQGLSPMVIHRDIKPANLVTRADGTLAVVDFGAAHVQGTTAGSTSIGTFGYMPIEQLAGVVDATTDPYALGASLLHLLSRREPWRILQGVSLEGINASPPMCGFLAKLVAPEPRDRFANARAALDALELAAAGKSITPPPKQRRRFPAMKPFAVGFAGAALALSGVATYALIAPEPERAVSAPLLTARVRVSLIANTMADLSIDGTPYGLVLDREDVPIAPGFHLFVVRSPEGRRCMRHVNVVAGARAEIECILVAPAPVDALPAGKAVSVDVTNAPLNDILSLAAKQCGVNLVVPDSIQNQVTIQLKDVPCDQALEVLLESRGLWYEYTRAANVVRVAPRVELDRDRANQRERDRQGEEHEVLPAGPPIDIDLKDAPIRDLAKLCAATGKVNIVVPESIDARVTARIKGVPWNIAFEQMLAANGLWYRYRPNGKIVRVAPRVELDREDANERERERAKRP